MTMQVTPDRKKAENLFNNAECILDSLNVRADKSEAIFMLKEEYEVLHLLAGAILAIDGEKIRDLDHHKALIIRIIEKYKPQFTVQQTIVWEELRKIRNDINYYGQKDKATLEDFYERNKEIILALRQKLFVILKEKLKKK